MLGNDTSPEDVQYGPNGPRIGVTRFNTSTESVRLLGQGPGVRYWTPYEFPAIGFEITPVNGFIVAPSPGLGLKENVPPGVIILVGPFVWSIQKSLKIKLAF